jgi:hypothetical protein
LIRDRSVSGELDDRNRWPALLAIEQKGKTASEQRRAIDDVLSDAPRPGTRKIHTPADRGHGCPVVRSPSLSGRPVTASTDERPRTWKEKWGARWNMKKIQ